MRPQNRVKPSVRPPRGGSGVSSPSLEVPEDQPVLNFLDPRAAASLFKHEAVLIGPAVPITIESPKENTMPEYKPVVVREKPFAPVIGPFPDEGAAVEYLKSRAAAEGRPFEVDPVVWFLYEEPESCFLPAGRSEGDELIVDFSGIPVAKVAEQIVRQMRAMDEPAPEAATSDMTAYCMFEDNLVSTITGRQKTERCTMPAVFEIDSSNGTDVGWACPTHLGDMLDPKLSDRFEIRTV